jgi:ketosteroid isomerase-like protein
MQDNAKIVAEIYSAFGRGDIASILDRVANDVDWNHSKSSEIPYGGHYSSRAEVQKFFDKISSAVEVKSFEPKSSTASGDAVFAAGTWSGKAKATGKIFETDWLMHWIIKNGKVTYLRVYEDTAVTAAALRK